MRSQVFHASALGLLLILGASLLGASADQYAMRRLERRLGADETDLRFPAEYFRQQAPRGASPDEVCGRMRGYNAVRYYLVSLAGGPDSVVVQQFRYPLVVGTLAVGVQYRDGRVADVDTERIGIGDSRPLTAPEARERLGVSLRLHGDGPAACP